MEARSLTALNNLAANPPQYPINPTDERQDPLTLYISRVPGTRDIILSPFKPQQKIVSSEDVASSLYYIHMEKPSGDLAYPPHLRDDGFGSSSDEGSSARNIPRKPLPGSAQPLAPSSRDHLPVPGYENSDPLRPRGHTVSSPFDETRMTPPHHEQDARRSLDGRGPDQQRTDWTPIRRQNTVVSRRPIGPRPIAGPPTPINDKPLPPPPYGPEVTMIDTDRANMRTSNPRRNMHASRSPSPRKQGEPSYTNPFTLAFIRRDPSTGNQWNVAHVSSYQSETTVQAEPDESGPFFPSVPPVASVAANPPINIQVETLGYGKFRNMPTRRSFDVGPGDGLPPDARVPVNDGAVLSRQVLMGYAKTWSTNFRQRWNQDGRGEHRRHGSVASVDSTGSGEMVSPGPQTSLGQPLPGMRPRGYVFTSPWNGRCEFRTGTTGRSLRCYHILSDEKTSINNMVEQQGVTLPAPGGAMPLSELRFNLPSRELFKTPEGREEVKTQIQGHFNKLLQRFDNRNEHSDEDDGTVSPFDVNLGKERAGGGKHGKRAKLGKLIIYPDGLKMLDLVVAANMGVWWGAWERSF